MDWPIHYRGTEEERAEVLRGQGVTAFAPLVSVLHDTPARLLGLA